MGRIIEDWKKEMWNFVTKGLGIKKKVYAGENMMKRSDLL